MDSRKLQIIILVAVAAGVVLLAPKNPLQRASSKPVGTVIEIQAPLGLPPVPFPSDNPPTAETIALGRRLYYDPALRRITRFPVPVATPRNTAFRTGKRFPKECKTRLGQEILLRF